MDFSVKLLVNLYVRNYLFITENFGYLISEHGKVFAFIISENFNYFIDESKLLVM